MPSNNIVASFLLALFPVTQVFLTEFFHRLGSIEYAMPEKQISLLRQMYSSALKFLAPLTPKETYKTVVKEACRLIGGDDGLVMLEKNGQFEIVYSSSEEAARITVRPRGFTYTAYETSEPFVLYPEDFAPIHP